MVKAKQMQWTDQLVSDLLHCQQLAEAEKNNGSTTALIDIVFREWTQLHPSKKTTKGGLKIKLSKIKNEMSNCKPSTEEDLSNGQLSNNKASSSTTDQQATESIDANEVKDNTTSPQKSNMNNSRQPIRMKIIKQKNRKQTWSDTMKKYLISSFKAALKKSNGKGKRNLEQLYSEARKRLVRKYPKKTITIDSVRHIIRGSRISTKTKIDIEKQNLEKMKEEKENSKEYRTKIKNKEKQLKQQKRTHNLTSDPEKLRKMKAIAEKHASKSIFAHVCYNCGRMLIKNRKNHGIYKIDPQFLDIDIAPAALLFPDLKQQSYTDKAGNYLACRNCKTGPADLYNCADPETGVQYVPAALKALKKPYELAQISLAGIINRRVKQRNDRLKIWDHFQGQLHIMQKFDNQYYGMYGFMIAKDTPDDTSSNESDSNRLIKRALKSLRRINRLYQKFYSNYDTLYRYNPEKIVHLNDASKFIDSNDYDLKHHLKDEPTGIVINLNEPDKIPHIEVSSDVAGFQHPIPDISKTIQELKDLTKVSYTDPFLEAKVFPHLFPFANGGWTRGSVLKQGEYLKHRLFNYDGRWRKDATYSYYFYDRQIKERLFYVAQARKAKITGRTEELTAGKMRDPNSNSFYEKLGQIVPATIPGSKSYWQSKLLDLLAMNRKLGTPTFFITLTQNDNWSEIQNFIQNGPGHDQQQRPVEAHWEKNEIFPGKDFSVETAEAYHNRLKLFREKIMLNKNGPLGEVVDYWSRQEFQSRGAIHTHMVVWCKEGTIPDKVVCAELPRGDGSEPMVDVLRSYVKRLQFHTCRKDRCLKDSLGKPLKKCKFGYPCPLQKTEEMNKAGNRFLPQRSCDEDTHVVPYNPETLLLWGAHMNIQKVTTSGWEMYLAKYVAKSEPSFSLNVSKDASDPEKYIRTRIIGRLEVDHINLGHFLTQSSRQIIFLPTEIESEYGFLKRKQHLPHDNNSTDVFYDNYLDKYMDRPSELENMLYEEWAAKFMPDRSGRPCRETNADSEDDSDSDQPKVRKVFTDQKGRQWKERTKEAIPRWRFFMPNGDKQELYYMQKLIFNLPLRRKTQLISPNNESKTYMEECAIRNLLCKEDDALNSLHDAHQRRFSMKDLRKLAHSLKEMNWIGQDDFNTFIDEISTIQHNNTNKDETEIADVDIESEEADMGNLVREEDPTIDLDQYISTFTESQKQSFQHITKQLASGKQVLVSIIGEAGTGKSYLLKAIVEYANRILHMSTRKLATTGVAAHLIGGETLHHFFMMDINSKTKLENGTAYYDMVNATDMIIIDEFSLLESKPFHAINRTLCEMAPSKTDQYKPFGGKSVILMGDPAQLPAIQKDIFESPLWHRFEIAILKTIKRQNNKEFQGLLSSVRLGKVTDEVDKILQSRKVDNLDIETTNLDNGAIICSLRKERDAWNEKFLQQLKTEGFTFEAEDSDLYGKPLKDSDKQRIRKYHKERLPDKLTLKVGARVVLARNIDIEFGWTNGTLAKVTNIHKHGITLQNLKTGRKTIITRVKQQLGFPGCNVKFLRVQFPIILGWALTVHKVQGMTLDNAYIQLNKNFFASGQAYVALSRVKSLEHLHLISYDKSAIYLDPFYSDLLKWMSTVDVIADVKQTPMKYPQRQEEDKKRKRPHAKEENENVTSKKANIEKPDICDVTMDESPGTTECFVQKETIDVDIHEFNYTESNIDLVITECEELNLLNNRLTLDLKDSKQSFLNKADIFEQIIAILREKSIKQYQPDWMIIDNYQQQHLHPVLEEHMRAVQTLGDGNCCFHSIWKQFFFQEENKKAAYLMRLLTLYEIYKNEDHYRQLVATEAAQWNDYMNRINSMNAHCGELTLIALSNVFNRPIYSYDNFISQGNNEFFFNNRDFDYLQHMFSNRVHGTRQHRLFEPHGQQFEDRQPITILHIGDHFTTLLYTTEQERHLKPYCNTWNIVQLLSASEH